MLDVHITPVSQSRGLKRAQRCVEVRKDIQLIQNGGTHVLLWEGAGSFL